MQDLTEMIDKAKECRSLKNDAELARVLGVTRAAVSSWRTGLKTPDDEACQELAKLLGEPELRVLAVVHAARARTEKARKMWARIASAACVVIALGMSGMSGKADAMPYQASSANTDNLYIIRSVIRWMVRLKVALRKPLWWVNRRSNTTWTVDPHALA